MKRSRSGFPVLSALPAVLLLIALALCLFSGCGIVASAPSDSSGVGAATPAADTVSSPSAAVQEQLSAPSAADTSDAFSDPVADGSAVKITVMVEGAAESVDGIHASGAIGVSVNYDPDRFTYSPPDGAGGVMRFEFIGNSEVWLTVTRVFGDADVASAQAIPEGAKLDCGTANIGGETADIVSYTAEDGAFGQVYTVTFSGRCYLIVSHCPADSAEGSGERLTSLLDTLVFLK